MNKYLFNILNFVLYTYKIFRNIFLGIEIPKWHNHSVKTKNTIDKYLNNIKDFFRGPKGEQGIKGEQGLKGEQGEKGLKGEQGLKGNAGEKGNRGLSGKTVTNNKFFIIVAERNSKDSLVSYLKRNIRFENVSIINSDAYSGKNIFNIQDFLNSI